MGSFRLVYKSRRVSYLLDCCWLLDGVYLVICILSNYNSVSILNSMMELYARNVPMDMIRTLSPRTQHYKTTPAVQIATHHSFQYTPCQSAG